MLETTAALIWLRTALCSPASVYVGLLPVVEAFVVVAVPWRVGEVRVPADEPEAVNLDGPGFGLGG